MAAGNEQVDQRGLVQDADGLGEGRGDYNTKGQLGNMGNYQNWQMGAPDELVNMQKQPTSSDCGGVINKWGEETWDLLLCNRTRRIHGAARNDGCHPATCIISAERRRTITTER